MIPGLPGTGSAAVPGHVDLAAAVAGQSGPAPVVALPAAVLFAAAAAFFVSAEVAVTRTAGMEAEAPDDDSAGARRLRAVLADPTEHLNAVLLLRVACEVVAAVALTLGFAGWLGPGWAAAGCAVVLMTVADYVLVGVTPRILGRQFAPSVASASVTALAPLSPVLGPVSRLLVRSGRALTPRNIGDRSGPFTSESELRRLVDLAERGHVIDADERQMIHSVFKLDDTSVREVMVPRTDIVFVERDASLDDALSLALRSGFSRIPVLGEDEDDVVGIVYLKDVVARIRREWARGGAADEAAEKTETVGEVMRAASYVPDSKPIDELLRDMQQRRIHVAVVIDEYGGTAGLVTIEDIVEEIVGEITDEYDDEVPPIERLDEHRARVTARLPLGELSELFGTELDAPDVETVGGLLAYALGRVPITGSEAVYAGLRLTAEDTVGRRNQTATVLVEELEPAQAEET
ncbi:hemolysin family protein [Streptomonospora litoralis]|uniref:Magnesium and cobalt efflux protein CorC n=1 Tax=Streptomonospora litoralis TaxID=2498135 RepID=A0A4P6PYK8_9ACTN|nr:hemolysin family protein [Streptomonospora litoralis]QBI53318.1 Magnesium and cobalt efflux protein CorC [Streptomonospora litoralis]